MSDNRYSVDRGKRPAKCQKCKQQIGKGELRLAKLTANPFTGDGEMKQYHHPNCLFETFKKARSTTRIIEDVEDIEEYRKLNEDDQQQIKDLLKEFEKFKGGKTSGSTPKGKAAGATKPSSTEKTRPATSLMTPEKKAKLDETFSPKKAAGSQQQTHKDNSFKEFRKLCATIAATPSYLSKTEAVKKFFNKGTDGVSFKGDLLVWVRLLLPGVIKRIYNLQSKQLVKIFSRIFGVSETAMLSDLEKGDVAETVTTFFLQSKKVSPADKACLTVLEVDNFLDRLTTMTLEDDQTRELTSILRSCTANDLKMLVRLIKGDLRIQAGAKHILEALHKDAYEAFNSSRNIERVIEKVLKLWTSGKPDGALNLDACIMQPVQPMLAMACKSVEMAFQKCPNGMFSEIKYDGERVQLHKEGKEFKYFSRSLKPVLGHKVSHFKEYIPKAFPHGDDMILDAEVLMVDNKTGQPLPFGTLGVHKAAGFQNATPCLFVFDCLHYNGENLMTKPIKERRKLLLEHMQEVGNNIKFSEMKLITKKAQLTEMIKDVLRQGLEGLVLKDVESPYEPGKRHWLKVKKDYLNDGAMADSADLVVLGAWFGSGQKGGIMSIFLMGCYDKASKRWYTVTKVHTGFDDATLDRLQIELAPNMEKIKQDFSKVPLWLDCTRQMAPDFVVKDPKASPVWEITGAEFSKAEIHTADGISIRFPRCTKIRSDKSWDTATSLSELRNLYTVSKQTTDFDIKEEVHEDTSKSPIKSAANGGIKETNPQEKISQDDHVKNVFGSSGNSFDKVRIISDYGMDLRVVKGDLFSADKNSSLAHCVSADFKLGKGIAKIFREKFGRIHELEKSGAKVGEIAVLKDNERFIYNLVTKSVYSDKGDYENLKKSLEKMRDHAKKHNVKLIALPKIGCGLDGLSWSAVRTLIKNVFLKEHISLTVYTLEGENYHLDKLNSISPMKRKSDTPLEGETPPKKSSIRVKTPLLDIFEGKPLTRINHDKDCR